jgi:hypothetical protein
MSTNALHSARFKKSRKEPVGDRGWRDGESGLLVTANRPDFPGETWDSRLVSRPDASLSPKEEAACDGATD